MTIKIWIIGVISVGFFSLEGFASPLSPSLKEFQGVKTIQKEEITEGGLQDPIETDSFCCNRQVKTGNAHSTRYNIEAILGKESYVTPKKEPSSSKGKK